MACFQRWPKILVTTFLCLGIVHTRRSFQEDVYALISTLFTDYQPEVRPTTDGGLTQVYLGFALTSIQDLDEKSQVLETSVILTLQWIDPWLAWNVSDFGKIDTFRYPQRKLWLPDVIVFNSVETQTQLGYDDCPIRIGSTGDVTWTPKEIIRTSCDIDVTYYPFDTQECAIILTTRVSYSWEIDLELITKGHEENTVDLHSYGKSGTWDLVATKVESLPNYASASQLSCTFTIKRLRTYYVVNIILPVLFLSFTASMVFYLPADAGEKMGMSITVLLAFAVYLTIVADKMPQTSLQTSILSVYLTLLLAVSAKSVFMCVLVLNLHHRPGDQPVGRKVAHVTRKLRYYFCMDNGHNSNKQVSETYKTSKVGPMSACPSFIYDGLKKEDVKASSRLRTVRSALVVDSLSPNFLGETEEQEKVKVINVTWPLVASTIDRLCFTSYSVFIAVITVVFVTILVVR